MERGGRAEAGSAGGWRAASRRAAAAALVAGTVALAGAPGPVHGDGAARPTRADLDAGRRRAARLESEYALAATRKTYLVLDLDERVVRYRLMGMTMREIPIEPVVIDGLVAGPAAADNPRQLAGIFTLDEKEGDPRLNPLTPEQVEAGEDDENAAAVFPPEPPRSYRLAFRQPLAIRVSGEATSGGMKAVAARLRDGARRLLGRGEREEAALRVALRLEPAVAAEFWRSIVPDQRWLVLPPEGLALPVAGQEPPPKPRAPRPARPPAAKAPKKPAPEEVPFRIPPPVDAPEAAGGGEAAGVPGQDANGTPPEGPPEPEPEPEEDAAVPEPERPPELEPLPPPPDGTLPPIPPPPDAPGRIS